MTLTTPTRRALLGAGLAALAVHGARAQAPTGIEPFVGVWRGTAMTERRTETRIDSRELQFELRPQAGGALEMKWASVQRGGGSSARPRQSSMILRPLGPGRWSGSGGSLGPRATAVIVVEGPVMTTTISERTSEGAEQQVFTRTLTSDGMRLRFRRTLDGKLTRTVDGVLNQVSR